VSLNCPFDQSQRADIRTQTGYSSQRFPGQEPGRLRRLEATQETMRKEVMETTTFLSNRIPSGAIPMARNGYSTASKRRGSRMKFKILVFLLMLAVVQRVQAQTGTQTATVNWATTYQTIQGFGAGNMFSGSAMNPYDNLLFNTLGYSLLRSAVPIGNGTCDGSPSSGCATGQDSVTDMQSCVANGCSVWAYVSNPPGEYNNSGSYMCTVAPALNVGDYAPFANYVTNYIASLRTYENVPLYAISVQNEPDPGAGGCQMTASGIDDFIKSYLHPTMSSAGQTNTKIMMPESSVYGNLTSMANTCMGDSACAANVGIVAYHGYDNPASPTDPYSPPIWETEVTDCCGFGPIAPGCSSDTWCSSISDALSWAGIVDNAMVNGNSAWHYFMYVDPDTFYGTNSNSALINPAQSPAISIRTYAIANWAKFVRPGWVRIGATHVSQSGVTVTAFKGPGSGGNFAIVAINTNGSDTAMAFSLSGFPTSVSSVTPWITSSTLSLVQQTNTAVSGGAFTYTLPANSVTTLVGNATTPAAAPSAPAAPAPPAGLTATVIQ
jgi:glucuronoarabinoxylan endo-1,4-beta-xylanase